MVVVQFIFWLLIIGIGSSLVLIAFWFFFSLVVNFWKTYCGKNASDEDFKKEKFN